METFDSFVVILGSGIRLGVPLILACFAGLWSERSGVVDIGLEGKMLTGAFAGAAFATFTGSVWVGLLAGVVATVGKLEAAPGAGNVIAGSVKASLDIRHADDNTRHAVVDALMQSAKTAAARRGVTLTLRTEMEQSAVPLDPRLTTMLHTAAARAGFPSRKMTSGAGHDAMILAPTIPSAMLFLRSPGGLSHHPDESVLPKDIEAAFATAMEFLALLSDDRTKDSHA